MKKEQKVAVGFFREDGKVKPITKPVRELKQKHMVVNPTHFQGISPQVQRQQELLKHEILNIDKQVESHSKSVNELKQRFEQCQQAGDVAGAQEAERTMTKVAFVLEQLSRKRERLTQQLK